MIYALIPILFLFMLFNINNDKIKSFIYALTIWGECSLFSNGVFIFL